MANVPVAQVKCRLDLSGPWTLRKYEFQNGTETMDLDRSLRDASASPMGSGDGQSRDGKRARSQSRKTHEAAEPDGGVDMTPSSAEDEGHSREPGKTMLEKVSDILQERTERQASTSIEDISDDPILNDHEMEEHNRNKNAAPPNPAPKTSTSETSKEVLSLIKEEISTATSPTKKVAPRSVALMSGRGWEMVKVTEAPKALYDQAEVPDINQPRARRKSTLNNSKALEAKVKRKAGQAGLGAVKEGDKESDDKLQEELKKISRKWKAKQKGVSGTAASKRTPKPKATKGTKKGRGKEDPIDLISDDEDGGVKDGNVAKKRKTAEVEDEKVKEKEGENEKVGDEENGQVAKSRKTAEA
ncbi:hypothetical protein HII31_13593 [Pseudocercospora fuligena]|uniref:Uncharacterized protein n=1 Tax=Pseudocercospora fuligena TaxID=685502 RepID=A0A8H6VFF7_9PEZI|nr:hypothetical protein HII31_13593 [Pseudocercospora fuligena]